MISLRELNNENLFKVIKLSDTLDENQKKVVAPNVISIAQAYVNQDIAWLRVIYLDDEPIGFVMVALKDEDIIKEDQPAYFLWRLMIAKPYQSKGYGKEVLDIIYDKCKTDHIKYLYVSCHIEDAMPYQFYVKYGFIDTHVMEDHEEILKIEIK
ncbi:MAG: GNAT family N-acetyltransferase [Acholeplasmataceae bacterium]|jgi:diamine N-acetyltransferase|nr:GNAT family N-acetyltransferase [Acholeplasmataceae bacterium]